MGFNGIGNQLDGILDLDLGFCIIFFFKIALGLFKEIFCFFSSEAQPGKINPIKMRVIINVADKRVIFYSGKRVNKKKDPSF
nr:hypothetical protein [Desulfobacula sp.]